MNKSIGQSDHPDEGGEVLKTRTAKRVRPDTSPSASAKIQPSNVLRGNETVEELEHIVEDRKRAALSVLNNVLEKKGFEVPEYHDYGLSKGKLSSTITLFLDNIGRRYSISLNFKVANPRHENYNEYLKKLASGEADLCACFSLVRLEPQDPLGKHGGYHITKSMSHKQIFSGSEFSSPETIRKYLEEGGLEKTLAELDDKKE